MKPTLYNIKAFDAKKTHTIPFIWNGNQAYKNICTIRNNSTNAVIYQGVQDTMQLRHEVPANSLANGALYNITIQVVDNNNSSSELSSPVLFYCYTTPTFKITNLAENQVIKNSSYHVSLSYSQPEGEELQYYGVSLHNMNKSEIWSSGIKYNTTELSTTISDLDDNGTYYIRATGYTINEMSLDTGYIPFSVEYEVPSMYAIVSLENKAREGMVKVQSNIITFSGSYSKSTEPSYINGDFVDLKNPENNVYFDEGFMLENDFTLNIEGYNFTDNSIILDITNGENTITLKKKRGTYHSENNIEKTFFELTAGNSKATYMTRSEYITHPNPSDILSVWIRRINHCYQVYVKKISS